MPAGKTNAVVLMNLGTPAAPTAGAVRTFLREFLSDKRVVEIPRPIWWCILNAFILPFRPRVVAENYAKIWTAEGSPLRVISEAQAQALGVRLRMLMGSKAPDVRLAMTYGEPRLANVVRELQAQGVERIIVLPLYPQYSATTSGAIYDQIADITKAARDIPDISVVKHYHARPDYIAALAASVRESWAQHGETQRLLLSFHGIPKRNVDLGDPYFSHCIETTQLLAAELGMAEERVVCSFQSRFGKAEWLQPYTVDLLRQWGGEGVESIGVLCPAFAADCLETLEEIDQENRHVFVSAGGGRFQYIPCLNDREDHIDMLASIVAERLGICIGTSDLS